jgi:Holliday junction resolvase RusA-like endonuclease
MNKLTLVFMGDEIPPGLNEMLRDWRYSKKKLKDNVKWIILEQNKNKINFDNQVMIDMTRYSPRYMDWDNFCAIFKSIGDALVDLEIIKDDSPKYVPIFNPVQVKAPKKDQRLIVVITEII